MLGDCHRPPLTKASTRTVLLQREQLRRRRRTLGEFGSSAVVCVTICFCLLLTRLVYRENQTDSTLQWTIITRSSWYCSYVNPPTCSTSWTAFGACLRRNSEHVVLRSLFLQDGCRLHGIAPGVGNSASKNHVGEGTPVESTFYRRVAVDGGAPVRSGQRRRRGRSWRRG